MSVEALSWVWGLEMDSAPRKLVLVAIADAASEEGACWPSYNRLAEKCSMSRDNVRRHVRKLEEDGLLTRVDQERRNGSRTSNLYQLSMQGCTPVQECPPVHQCTPPPVHQCTPQNRNKEPVVTPPTPPSPDLSPVEHLWARFVEMRQRSPKKLRRIELDPQTTHMISEALKVGSVEEWSEAIDAILLSPHHVGQNDRGTAYLDPRHIFTARSHGTVRQHLDWLLDLSQTAGNHDGVTSALTAKVRDAKVNVVAAFDLAGSAAARRKGDESREFLAQHGIVVVFDGPGGRPRFEESADPQR